MTERKWTPGKWLAQRNPRHGALEVFSAGVSLADVNDINDVCMGPTTKEATANAHLISAAPDLYDDNQAAIDSLEFALSEMQENDIITQDDAELVQERIASLKASAAKARGEAQ